MRTIDLETWPRQEHFKFFGGFARPHCGMCANVDVTAFYHAVKQRGDSLTVAIVYLVARASNAIPEFRQRIRGETVVEHEIVHPGFTILVSKDLFSFCTVDYVSDFREFAARAAERIAFVKENPWVNEPPRDDTVYMTAIPWVSFTGFMHPMPGYPTDSIPRFAWGKIFEEGDRLKMPLAVQGHHGLVDGIHIGRFYAYVEAVLQQPETALGSVSTLPKSSWQGSTRVVSPQPTGAAKLGAIRA